MFDRLGQSCFVWICAALLLLPMIVCSGTAGIVSAAETAAPRVVYELDVLPVLTAAGCNAGACHGKSRGQNGFALSLLGFDPDFDYASIVLQGRGRRVFPAAPEHSLLLQKGTAQLPHGGGERLAPGSAEYETVRQWIASGMPRATADDPVLTEITLAPQERILSPGEHQQLSVTAHYSDGSTRDVTRLTSYQSNESAVVGVTSSGEVRAGELPGEATIMARYLGKIATWGTAIPLDGQVDASVYAALPRTNFIDELIWQKLQELRITPGPPCPDHVFLRRAHLDLIGRLPTPEEARRFLEDSVPDKRARLIDALLERPEYADFWANKWMDLLRPNPYRVGIKATLSMDAWVRDAFRRNLPHDEFVRGLVAAQGSTWRNGAATLHRDRREPEEIATMVSQLFLGIRLECAKCHQHPSEVWGQSDFYGFAAFFARVGRKGTGLSPPISGGEEIVYTADKGTVKHPLTGAVMEPRPLFGELPTTDATVDPREQLVDWMVAPENHYFARVAVNRIWADLMGRGLVEPVDDLRATNPASNEALLAALAEEFRRVKFDNKAIIRTIATSYAYGLDSIASDRNSADTRNYSRHYRQRLRGEVLLDAISDVTGIRDDFPAMPPESRAVEIWTHRVRSQFLDAFGRPNENLDPPCERTSDPSVVQVLHLMNAENLHRKVTSSEGRIARLSESDKSPTDLVEELYLLVYSRFPSDEERTAVAQVIEAAENRRQVLEDLAWAMINTPEFVFKH